MSLNNLYNEFLQKRMDNKLSELIKIDLSTNYSEKNRKKKNLILFLKNRNKIFIRMKEKNIISRREYLGKMDSSNTNVNITI